MFYDATCTAAANFYYPSDVWPGQQDLFESLVQKLWSKVFFRNFLCKCTLKAYWQSFTCTQYLDYQENASRTRLEQFKSGPKKKYVDNNIKVALSYIHPPQ
jgi:hypothetical protein